MGEEVVVVVEVVVEVEVVEQRSILVNKLEHILLDILEHKLLGCALKATLKFKKCFQN